MRIQAASQSQAIQPVAAAPAAVKPAAEAQAVMAKDELRVITYNTAVGNPKIKTNQADFVKLPFYQDVIQGAPNAPILCLQEVGKPQLEALKRHAERTGNFRVEAQWVSSNQYDVIVVPKRFEIQYYQDHRFGTAQGKAALSGLKSFFEKLEMPGLQDLRHPVEWFKRQPFNKLSQLVTPRGYQHAKLRDTNTGKSFDLFNTHISFQNGVQQAQAKRLFSHADRVDAPVIVAGDLNVRTAETDPGKTAKHAETRAFFDAYTDVSLTGPRPGKPNIDYVLVKGFTGVNAKWYAGDSIALPGSPNAETVSDHYAEETVIRFSE